MLKVTFEINSREIGTLCISLNNNDNGVGDYTSTMTTDGFNEPANKSIHLQHRRRDGAFELVRRCLEAHLDETLCISCGNTDISNRIGIEYPHEHPEHYDGVSEWLCTNCDTRVGRWSGLVLNDGESEKRY